MSPKTRKLLLEQPNMADLTENEAQAVAFLRELLNDRHRFNLAQHTAGRMDLGTVTSQHAMLNIIWRRVWKPTK